MCVIFRKYCVEGSPRPVNWDFWVPAVSWGGNWLTLTPNGQFLSASAFQLVFMFPAVFNMWSLLVGPTDSPALLWAFAVWSEIIGLGLMNQKYFFHEMPTKKPLSTNTAWGTSGPVENNAHYVSKGDGHSFKWVSLATLRCTHYWHRCSIVQVWLV